MKAPRSPETAASATAASRRETLGHGRVLGRVVVVAMGLGLLAGLLGACSSRTNGSTGGSSADLNPGADSNVDDASDDASDDANDDANGDANEISSSDDAAPDGSPGDDDANDDANDDTTSDDAGVDTTDDANGGGPVLVDAGPGVCQSAVTSISDMPLGSEAVDFETCTGCDCCNSDGSYPATMAVDCLECAPAGALAKVGATLKGGELTTLVTCVTGNAAAPLADHGLFVGGGWLAPNGLGGLEILLDPPARMLGFSAVPTASDAKPTFVLRGYDASGAQIAEDTFVFASAPGGACATVNPAAQFFGFRPCSDALLGRVVVETTDANVAIDAFRVWRP